MAPSLLQQLHNERIFPASRSKNCINSVSDSGGEDPREELMVPLILPAIRAGRCWSVFLLCPVRGFSALYPAWISNIRGNVSALTQPHVSPRESFGADPPQTHVRGLEGNWEESVWFAKGKSSQFPSTVRSLAVDAGQRVRFPPAFASSLH